MGRPAALYGDKFNSLDPQERMIVAFVLDEKVITHTRLAEVLPDIHPRDLSEYLKKLTNKGFIEAHGKTRAMVYQVPGAKHLAPDDVFSAKVSTSSEHLESSSTHLESSSTHLNDKRQDEFGRWLVDELDVPIIGDLNNLDEGFKQTLFEIAKEARASGKLDKEAMINIILQVCVGHYVPLPVLAELLNRTPRGLRQNYLGDLLKANKICLAFPGAPTDPRQAYKAL